MALCDCMVVRPAKRAVPDPRSLRCRAALLRERRAAQLAFASRIRDLVKAGVVRQALSADGMAEFLMYCYLPGTHTLHESVSPCSHRGASFDTHLEAALPSNDGMRSRLRIHSLAVSQRLRRGIGMPGSVP